MRVSRNQRFLDTSLLIDVETITDQSGPFNFGIYSSCPVQSGYEPFLLILFISRELDEGCSARCAGQFAVPFLYG